MFALLPDAASHHEYYLTSDTFSNSPTNTSTPPDASPHPDLQANSPTSGISSSSPSSVTMARGFRPSSHGLGIAPSRSMPIIPLTPANGSPGQQQMSPSHGQHSHLSTHPHMHPSPYYPLSHNAGSPGFPSTPTSHHTQGSSSSSHSSSHTRYSFRGSPGSRFGRGHARSSSYGTVSTMSVRSSSPASSVASAFTSLSGGAGGSAPGSTSGPVGSPTTYGESGDMQMSYANVPRRDDRGQDSNCHQVRSQSHPPLSMPTAHPAIGAYAALLPQPGKGGLQQGTGVYMTTGGGAVDDSRESMWPSHVRTHGYLSPSVGPRMNEEGIQAQFPPKSTITKPPHRKQKLANSDRKAICMYAKQHPSARQEDIAARYNVERSTISKILKNKERWLGCPDDDAKVARKRCVGFVFLV
ncbi:hypothetical protein JB92DRAFT_1189867 [Gautieria morchelliformis]|nr:hypothetical protein JB92DRAFT_1189867 [Gautieria morchelliformis]